MAELSFEVGNPVFLNVHLGSGSVGKFAQAIVKDASGTILATIDLIDEADGSYFNNTDYLMPNLPFIQVAYKIYDDAGHTTISEDDQDGSVIFARKDVADALVRNDAIVGVFEQTAGEFTGVFTTAGEFVGEFSQGEIIAAFDSNELTGIMIDNTQSFVGLIDCK